MADEALIKRVHTHARTVAAWLSHTNVWHRRNNLEDQRMLMRTLATHHVMKSCNAPLLRAIVVATPLNKTSLCVDDDLKFNMPVSNEDLIWQEAVRAMVTTPRGTLLEHIGGV